MMTAFPSCFTHENVVLNSDEMTAPEIGRRQRGHEQLLVLPIVVVAGPNFAPAHGTQLTSLRLDHFAPRHVLNCLKLKKHSHIRVWAFLGKNRSHYSAA